MKIAVISHLDYPICQPFYGGLEAHTWYLCQLLTRRGHDVYLFASGDSDSSLNLVPVIPTAFKLKLPHQETDLRRIKRSLYASVLRQIQSQDFDLVHNNSLNPLPIQMAHRLDRPVLTVLHTPPFYSLVEAVMRVPPSPAVQFLTVSRSAQRQWWPYICSDVVYNGIDLNQWKYSKTSTDYAIWFGRFVPEKRPHLAIQAALEAGFRVKVAGPSPDPEYFRLAVQPLLDNASVTYLQHLSHAQLSEEIGTASVFVNFPEWEEPYGLVYAEALACGTPVVTCRRGAGSEIVNDACGRIIEEAQDPSSFIQEAAKLSRAACRDRAVSFCNIEATIDAYEQYYSDLLKVCQASTQLPLAN